MKKNNKVTEIRNNMEFIEIQRSQIVDNIVGSIKDSLNDEGDDFVKSLCDLLKTTTKPKTLREAFCNGYTVFFMGNLMARIENIGKEAYIAIVVKDGNNVFTIIPDDDIKY